MSTTIPTTGDEASGASDDIVERILGELDPIVTQTREALARVWHDRSLSKANLHVLMLLEQYGAISMSRLADLIDVSLPNMTGIVDRMADNGLVERVRDEDDRRVVLVRSTAKGAELATELPGLRRAYLRRVITALPESDRRICFEAFRAFRHASEALAAVGEQHSEHPFPGCTGHDQELNQRHERARRAAPPMTTTKE